MSATVIVNLPGNVQAEIQPPVHQQKFWLKGKYYEQAMLDYIRVNYPGGTYIDGGACIGNHTLYFAALCAQQVIAVEPVKRNAAHLWRNWQAKQGLANKNPPVGRVFGSPVLWRCCVT